MANFKRESLARDLFKRFDGNPILEANNWPYPVNSVFNPAAIKLPDGTLLLARVEDMRGFSHLTLCKSKDGLTNRQTTIRTRNDGDWKTRESSGWKSRDSLRLLMYRSAKAARLYRWRLRKIFIRLREWELCFRPRIKMPVCFREDSAADLR
jgi:hypothetical protein